MRRAAFASWAGLAFAVLQFSTFCVLEERLSSSWMTYAVVTAAWMAGIIGGLRLARAPGAADDAFAAVAGASYYGIFAGVRLLPVDNGLLALYGLLVCAMGAFAGRFFRSRFDAWGDPRALFLHENNGFLYGLLLSFAGFYGRAEAFLALAPAGAVAGLCLLRNRGWDR